MYARGCDGVDVGGWGAMRSSAEGFSGLLWMWTWMEGLAMFGDVRIG